MVSFEPELDHLRQRGLCRQYREVERIESSRIVTVDGRRALNLCSCDYLELSLHPRMISTLRDAAAQYGCSTGGSRFIGGTHPLHHEVEHRIAQFHAREACALFNTGYMANVGALSSLIGEADVVYSDELNHASIIDGLRLSRCRKIIWRHNDLGDLRAKLESGPRGGRCWIVCESLYSMDGDCAPLAGIVELARRYSARIYVDEIHSVGLRGPSGRGLAAELGLDQEVDVLMAGAAKALGAMGGYVVADRTAVEWMKSNARSFIFTISLPPVILRAIECGLELVRAAERSRAAVRERAAALRARLRAAGVVCLGEHSQILPVVVGGAPATNRVCEELLERGYYVQGVTFPTVPEDSGRLRVTVLPSMSVAELDAFAHHLLEILPAQGRGS